MTTTTTAINLAELPPPEVVEQISYDQQLTQLKARLSTIYPDFNAMVESDPVIKILEIMAYELVRYRQQKNEDLKAVMLAYSKGSDLDHLGALVGVLRLTVDPGKPEAVPPIPPTMETDDDYRARIQMAPEDFTNAGTGPRYRSVAMAAHGDIKDASAISPAPGQVSIAILSRDGDGTPTSAALNAVRSAVLAPDVYQLTDQVSVISASIIRYQVHAKLHLQTGPDKNLVINEARGNLQRYVKKQHGIGRPVTQGGLYAALHVPGVDRVELKKPTTDILPESESAAWCESFTVQEAG